VINLHKDRCEDLRAKEFEGDSTDEYSYTKDIKRYKTIVQESNAGYFFIDKNGFIRDVNQAWVKLYKYDSSDEVIGRHFSVIQQFGDQEAATKFVAEIMKGNESYLTGIFSRRCKDGSICYHSYSSKPVFDGNEVIGLEGFILDITERQLKTEVLCVSERQFRKAEAVAGFGHWEYHLDDQLIFASKGASNI